MNSNNKDALLAIMIVFLLFASCVNCACESCQNGGSANRNSSSLTSEAAAPADVRLQPRARDLPRATALESGVPVASRINPAGSRRAPSPLPSLRDSILVECAEAHRCPGPNAVFVGARVDWVVRSASGLGGACEAAEERPTGVVAISTRHVDGLGEVVSLRALQPGIATVAFRSRSLGLATARQLRVVSVEDAVRGEVRLRAGTKGEAGRYPAEADLVGAGLPSSIAAESPQLVLTWVLEDGTRALGGAARVSSSGTEGRVVALGRGASERDDLERSLFRFFGAPGTVQLSAAMGQARLEQSFDYAYRAPALRPCAAGDSSDFLDASDAGSDGTWPTLTSGLMARLGQDVFFPFDANLPDVTVEQSCGPEQVVPYPQAEGFAARFSSAGRYQFVLKDAEGKLLRTGASGEPIANPYTVVAGR